MAYPAAAISRSAGKRKSNTTSLTPSVLTNRPLEPVRVILMEAGDDEERQPLTFRRASICRDGGLRAVLPTVRPAIIDKMKIVDLAAVK